MDRKPSEFRIVNHGPDSSSYFPGHGVAFTSYTDCATGAGHTPQEALEDALEQLATNDWDTAEIDASEDAVALKASKKSVDDWHECGKVLPDNVEIHEGVDGRFYLTRSGKTCGQDTFTTEEEAKAAYLEENADDLCDGCDHYWYVSVDVRE